MVVVYPETSVSAVTRMVRAAIADEHLRDGRVVEAYRYVASAGDNKIV